MLLVHFAECSRETKDLLSPTQNCKPERVRKAIEGARYVALPNLAEDLLRTAILDSAERCLML